MDFCTGLEYCYGDLKPNSFVAIFRQSQQRDICYTYNAVCICVYFYPCLSGEVVLGGKGIFVKRKSRGIDLINAASCPTATCNPLRTVQCELWETKRQPPEDSSSGL